MRDSNLVLLSSQVVTTTTTGSAVDFGSGDRKAIGYVLVVTSATGTTPTLDAVIKECDTSGGTYANALSFDQVSAAGVARITGKLNERYRKVVLTTGGTSPNFYVEVYAELGGHYQSY